MRPFDQRKQVASGDITIITIPWPYTTTYTIIDHKSYQQGLHHIS